MSGVSQEFMKEGRVLGEAQSIQDAGLGPEFRKHPELKDSGLPRKGSGGAGCGVALL